MQVNQCMLIEPFVCNEEDNIVEVAKNLRSTTLRHIFVTDAKGFPKGVISVMDINNRVVAEGKDLGAIKAKDIMTRSIDVFNIDDDLSKVCESMLKKNHVMDAVVKDSRMIGIITVHEALKVARNHE